MTICTLDKDGRRLNVHNLSTSHHNIISLILTDVKTLAFYICLSWLRPFYNVCTVFPSTLPVRKQSVLMKML
jgi:hypothetical protein